MLLEVAQDRFREVADKLLDLAAGGERWAVELVLDRCLGKVPEPSNALDAPNLNQVNITLPAPAGREGETVPGLLDDEP